MKTVLVIAALIFSSFASAQSARPLNVMYSITPDVMFENAQLSPVGENKIQDILASGRMTYLSNVFVTVTHPNEITAAKMSAVIKSNLLQGGLADNQLVVESKSGNTPMIMIQVIGIR
jgi:hypothetical protein